MSKLFVIFSQGINQTVASFLANKVIKNLPGNFEKREQTNEVIHKEGSKL